MTTAPNRDAYWESPGALRTSEKLSSSECWALAATQQTGRIGFFRGGLLDIFPVTYFVMDEHVYFRTSADGTIATSYLDHAAFQIDHVDRDAQNGWTILLNGPATRVEDPELLTTLWGKAVDEPWAPNQRDLFYELASTHVRGRRFGTTH
ncbi:pyridoxamine 5'-phosphate oxidase family protein [Arthrobacter sp. L77]|uniref:pyridoxamine 5'-phosphate oxidase family protein n=1 Tax=Arthrobacter sp. L77 TaxID=1496689 RepID=UPI0018CF4A8C|nr:pyridoxamine 5'-phosphate oxidase family protein [Arthrobacter sp. L77]